MKAKLALFHPGGLAIGDPSFENYAAVYALHVGFNVAKSFDYPLCDPREAVRWARQAVVAMASDGSAVYAYGDSGGAMLAARLAQLKSVRSAACYSPLTVDYAQWIRDHPGATPMDCLRGLPDDQNNAAAPGLYDALRPVLCVSGVDDSLAHNSDAVAWDARDPLVWTWQVDGGHLGSTISMAGGPPNPVYVKNMHRAIDWLWRRATRALCQHAWVTKGAGLYRCTKCDDWATEQGSGPVPIQEMVGLVE